MSLILAFLIALGGAVGYDVIGGSGPSKTPVGADVIGGGGGPTKTPISADVIGAGGPTKTPVGADILGSGPSGR